MLVSRWTLDISVFACLASPVGLFACVFQNCTQQNSRLKSLESGDSSLQ